MTRTGIVRGILVAALAVAMTAVATPALAQMGSMKGKVVDEKGAPVPEADVTFDFIGDVNRQFTAKTNAKGEWIRAGLPAAIGTGSWTISAKKGDLVGRITHQTVDLGGVKSVPDIVVKSGTLDKVENLSAAETEKRNKENTELKKTFDEANAALASNNYDEAITKLTALTDKLKTCGACYVRLGDVYIKKQDYDNAEKAFLKAIEVDPKSAESYSALANIYNQQKKFDDAVKMSTKANELSASSPTGGDPTTVFNQGIIFWNQSKIPEAKAQFEKAIQLNPRLADAQYWYGMALVNEGKMADAKKPFEEYLKLAPTGQYAETAKAILAQIK